MKDIKTKSWVLNQSMPYFVHDPEGDGFTYFTTEKERDEFASEAIQEYLDDGWSEEVTYVVTGVITHRAAQTDLVHRPCNDELDEEGMDEDGVCWDADWDYICNYKLLPLTGG